jgi:1-acyl-sn-glycerol-3-phosphate acyltransferase
MVYRIIYYFANIILRVYYRKIHVYGLDTIPKDKPLLIVSNHPSGFLEPHNHGLYLSD